jgi:glycosyltransferase involved in cell wall biosynthesis
MWTQTLGPLGRAGIVLEERLAPPFYRRRPIVTLSPSSKRELVDDLGFREESVTVVPPGINPFFTPGGERSPTPLVVAVGRLAPVKDFPRLVRVVARARDRVGELDLVIVGEGYHRDEVLAEVDRVGGRDWVHLPGRVDDEELRALYRRAWVAASASTREGWGMTLTEAAACGTPTVATDIPGHADAVAAGRSGLLGTTDDELTGALATVLGDEDERRRLSAGALQRAAELSWEAAALANFRVLAADAVARRERRRGGLRGRRR